VEKYRNPHGQLEENLFLPLYNTNFISKFFGKDILILWRITDLSTSGSVGLKRRNNERKDFLFFLQVFLAN
jgi:hypothetical protein